MADVKSGLEGVVIGQQDICLLDGDKGDLIYRGYHIDELAPNASYEEVVYLLWHGQLPNQQELAQFTARLANQRMLSTHFIRAIQHMPKSAHPMEVCRTGASMLGFYDTEDLTFDREANLRRAEDILAHLPTIMAAFSRHRKDLPPVTPRDDLGHAANFLWMVTGKEPSPEAVSALNMYFVLLADLEHNASAFACRVTAATWADMYASVVSGICALSGSAHGGALQQVMGQFQEIGQPDKVEAWFETALQNKRRLMGIGHRVFKVLDPRAPHLRARVEALAGQSEHRQWFDIAARLDELSGQHPFFQERKLYPNVDYYAAVLLYMLGLKPDMFTTVFACSRTAGWTTHIMHQYANNRLIRPRGEYTGPTGLKWTPIEER